MDSKQSNFKLIVNAPPEDAPAVVAMMLDKRAMFDRRPERLGWGWTFLANDKVWFVRQIKGGLSACPARSTRDGQ